MNGVVDVSKTTIEELEARILKLLISKTEEEQDDNQRMLFNIMISITRVVREWMKDKKLEGVVDEDNMMIKLEEVDINDWVFAPRTIRKKQILDIVYDSSHDKIKNGIVD